MLTAPPRRARVELIDEDDVGCTGKKRKPRDPRPPAEGDASAQAPAAASSQSPDINYPAPSSHGPIDDECMCAPPPCCYRKRIGNMYVCCERRVSGNPRILCTWPACWAMQCFTQMLVWGIGGPVFFFSFPTHPPWCVSRLASIYSASCVARLPSNTHQ